MFLLRRNLQHLLEKTLQHELRQGLVYPSWEMQSPSVAVVFYISLRIVYVCVLQKGRKITEVITLSFFVFFPFNLLIRKLRVRKSPQDEHPHAGTKCLHAPTFN